MNLKSFGCSFIYGSELADDTSGTSYSNPSQLTWPALYAKELGYKYQCYARPGSGNLQIAESILNQLALNEQGLYVIGWTWIDRFDYTNSEDPSNSWQTIMPNDPTIVARAYYRYIHSQYRDKLTTLLNIKLVIDALKQKGVPFIMTYMDNIIFETEWHTNPAIVDLQNYIRTHMTTFNGNSFLDWSRQNNFLITEKWHPLEDAHLAGYKYISELGVYKK